MGQACYSSSCEVRNDVTQDEQAIKITIVDRVGEGLVVLFSDGTSATFSTDFLYEARNQNGNQVLPRENRNELPGHE